MTPHSPRRVVGKRPLQLATVAPDAQGKREDLDTSPPREGKSPHAAVERLRAIAERAPEPVRELFRKGLIGTKEAARLGPRGPTPEKAAEVTAIANEVTAIARTAPAGTERERREVARKVNETVRARLNRNGSPPPDATPHNVIRFPVAAPPDGTWNEFDARDGVVDVFSRIIREWDDHSASYGLLIYEFRFVANLLEQREKARARRGAP